MTGVQTCALPIYKCKLCVKEYSIKNKERAKTYYKDYGNIYNERWLKKNPNFNAEYSAKRRKEPFFKLKDNLRNRIRKVLKIDGYKKSKITENFLGCSFKIAKEHLEKQFNNGMSWDNQGKWHIDHIIPLASAKTEEELIKLCHYTNLQPLWAFDNLSKGDKIL